MHLLGEQPYDVLPSYLHQFDVAIIPFKLTELTQNVNPVKLYEYLSAGVPVVASPMSELLGLGDLVYLAGDPSEFVGQVERALREDDEDRRAGGGSGRQPRLGQPRCIVPRRHRPVVREGQRRRALLQQLGGHAGMP